MSWLFAVPLAISVGLVAWQFWLMLRVRDAMAQRHPQLWKSWSLGEFLPYGIAVFGFAFSLTEKRLNDAALSERAAQFRIVTVVTVVSWGAAVFALAVGSRSCCGPH